jgi:hypothetical protein
MAVKARPKVIKLNSKKILDMITERIFKRNGYGKMTDRDNYMVWEVILDRELGDVKKRMASIKKTKENAVAME